MQGGKVKFPDLKTKFCKGGTEVKRGIDPCKRPRGPHFPFRPDNRKKQDKKDGPDRITIGRQKILQSKM